MQHFFISKAKSLKTWIYVWNHSACLAAASSGTVTRSTNTMHDSKWEIRDCVTCCRCQSNPWGISSIVRFYPQSAVFSNNFDLVTPESDAFSTVQKCITAVSLMKVSVILFPSIVLTMLTTHAMTHAWTDEENTTIMPRTMLRGAEA